MHPPKKHVNKHTNSHSLPWPAAGVELHSAQEAPADPAAEPPDLQTELSSENLPGPGTTHSQKFCL